MQRSVKRYLAVAIASGVSLMAGTAGAAFDSPPPGYYQCLAAGNNECLMLHGEDPDAYNQCIAVFYENCRVHWGVPGPGQDPCEKGAPNPEDCPIIN